MNFDGTISNPRRAARSCALAAPSLLLGAIAAAATTAPAAAVAPSAMQIGLAIASAILFALSAGATVARLRHDGLGKRLIWQAALWAGIALALGALVGHAVARQSWVPFEDNFDALIWIGLLLSLHVVYVQARRPIGGLDTFVLPIVALLMIGAAVLGGAAPHAYLDSAWSWLHRTFAFAATVALFFAGAAGGTYLYKRRLLKAPRSNPMLQTESADPRDPAIAGPMPIASLERLEHATFVAVTVGFAMLTISLIMGFARLASARDSAVGLWSPKVLLSLAVWVIYALVLHTPLNPRFRGQRVAILSVVGFVLLMGALASTQFMSARGPMPTSAQSSRDVGGEISGEAR